MPVPESTSVSLRQDLAASVREYDALRAAAMFIGRAVAPVFPTVESAGNFPVFCRESFKKPVATNRTEGGAYNRVETVFGSGTFLCEEHGLEEPVDDRRRRRYARYFNAEEEAAKHIRYLLLLDKEIRAAAISLGNANFTTHTPSVVWSTAASAVPLNDLMGGCETLEDSCGLPRSEYTLIIPRADKIEFLGTAQITNKSQYTYPGLIPAQLQNAQIASMLGIKQVLSPGGAYDSTEEGVAESMSQIWTAGAVMLCVLANPGESMETPSAFRTMVYAEGGEDEDGLIVESYRDERVRGEVVRVREDTDEILTTAVDLLAWKMST